VYAVSGWHQLWLSLLATAIFLLNMAPLELQRRIIDAAVKGNPFRPILMLGVLYVGVVLAFGLIKLFAIVYRGWIAESATYAVRGVIDDRLAALPEACMPAISTQ
jgi:ABC-type multidrug transport system fused ATPase/permease subunit